MGLRSKSGIKRAKTSKKRHDRNLKTKQIVKKTFKAAEKAIISKASDVAELVRKAFSAVDKAVQRGIIHQNKAARSKSRLVLKLNKSGK